MNERPCNWCDKLAPMDPDLLCASCRGLRGLREVDLYMRIQVKRGCTGVRQAFSILCQPGEPCGVHRCGPMNCLC